MPSGRSAPMLATGAPCGPAIDLAPFAAPAMLLDAGGVAVAANDRAAEWLVPASAGAALSGAIGRDGASVVPAAGDAGGPARELTVVPLVAGGALVVGHDATAERALRDALIESRRRFKELVELGSDFAWETDAAGAFAYVSPCGAIGFPAHRLVGRPAAAFLLDPALDAGTLPFATAAPVVDIDVWMRTADGAAACVATSAVPVFDTDGAWCGARGICRDVTADRRHAARLAAAEARERLIAYVVRRMHDQIEPQQVLAAAAEATARAVGGRCAILRADGLGRFVAAAGAPAEPPDGLGATAPTAAGGGLWIATDYRGAVNGALAVFRDGGDWDDDDRALVAAVAAQLGIAIAQIANHERLAALSRTDELTGLLNRRAFFDDLQHRLARMRRGGASGVLFYIDLDNFKLVNDRRGHAEGDRALATLAGILLDSTRPDDLVARLGGDEFAVWMSRLPTDAAEKRAADLVVAARPMAGLTDDPARPLGVSIGLAVYEAGSEETPADFIARADAAMYAHKRTSKGGWRLAPPRTTTEAEHVS
ncbi:MAG: diguanylate cyclase [Rhodospirillales bacterium]